VSKKKKPSSSKEVPKRQMRVPSITKLRALTDPRNSAHVPQAQIADEADIPAMTLNDAISGVTRNPNPELVSAACNAGWTILDRRERDAEELKR